jgi:peptidoglycan/LPS O-acetylase OafA/YrhL
MKTPSLEKSKLYGLDHLRALAILLVFVYHYGRLFASPQWVTTIGKFGWTGVDLFFVLSGYLIASQLFAKTAAPEGISFKDFFIKRFFRIIPAYLVVVAIYFLFPVCREREAPAPLWKYLTFTQNLGLDLRHQGTFSHAWSLCIEEQFYLLLPIVLIILSYFKALKKGWILIVLFFVIGFAARLYCWYTLVVPYAADDSFWMYWYKWIYYPTYSRLDGLLLGISIAAVFQFRPALKEKIQQHGNTLLFASILLLAAAYFVCINEQSFGASIFGFTLVDIGYGVMVLGAVSSSSFLYKRRSFLTTRLAALSYAVYLTHKIVIHLIQQYLVTEKIDKESNTMLFMCVMGSLLAGYLLNILIEKPFLRMREKLIILRHEKTNERHTKEG